MKARRSASGRNMVRPTLPSQVADEIQLGLDMFHRAVRAAGDAQHPRLALLLVLVDQVGAAFEIVKLAQALDGCAVQPGGPGKHVLLA